MPYWIQTTSSSRVTIIEACLHYQQEFISSFIPSNKKKGAHSNALLLLNTCCVLEVNAWLWIWNLYSLFLCSGGLSQKLMITQERCANTWDTGKVWWLSSCELFLCIQTYPAQSLSLLGELSQSIMCSLFLTFIPTVWVYMVYSQFEMTLVLSRCWKIYLRLMPS